LDNFGIENPLEQVKEEIRELEAKESQHEAEEKQRARFNNTIALTISVYAVLSAFAGMKESQITTASLLEMDNAVLSQAQATDQWNFYDSKSLKSDVTKELAQIVPALPSAPSAAQRILDGYQKSISDYESDKSHVQAKARGLEQARDQRIKATDELVKQHHKAGLAETFIQIAIVLASVSSLLRRKWLWFGSLGLAGVAVFFLLTLTVII
jgi:hypothetical protein